jgi:hypothetical protein
MSEFTGELQSRDAKETGPCFRPSHCPQNAISGRKMDQSPDFAGLLDEFVEVKVAARQLSESQDAQTGDF